MRRGLLLAVLVQVAGCAPDVWGSMLVDCTAFDRLEVDGSVVLGLGYGERGCDLYVPLRGNDAEIVEKGRTLKVSTTERVVLTGRIPVIEATAAQGSVSVGVEEASFVSDFDMFASGDTVWAFPDVPGLGAWLDGPGSILVEDDFGQVTTTCDGCNVGLSHTSAVRHAEVIGANTVVAAGCPTESLELAAARLVVDGCATDGMVTAALSDRAVLNRSSLATLKLTTDSWIVSEVSVDQLELEILDVTRTVELDVEPLSSTDVSVTAATDIRISGLDADTDYDLDLQTSGAVHTFLVEDADAGVRIAATSSGGDVVVQVDEGGPLWGIWQLEQPQCTEQEARVEPVETGTARTTTGWRFNLSARSLRSTCLPFGGEDDPTWMCELVGEAFTCDEQQDNGVNATFAGRFTAVDRGEITYTRDGQSYEATVFRFASER